ncbi:V-type ATPase subunit [Haploplasma axanthum]|uniref:V-type ATP synthase subunit C n=1 Tax=Haploplasma axanthum TaxID=29552 RepID=A0A449BCG6_HAPAX|nr:V-type ATPase subunit [Haploplasma axanthum]VEU80141.1 Uncharacterised protein [Haploplasma axanthum]
MDINFLNGVYNVKVDSMLSDDDFNTLKRLEKSLFFKYLKTKDYGFGSKYHSLDEIIAQEIINTKLELESYTDEKIISFVFYLEHDLTNIKIVFKELKYNVVSTMYDNVGNFPNEALHQFFKYDNKALLPNEVYELFDRIKLIDSKNIQETLQNIEKCVYDFYDEYLNKKKTYYPLKAYLEYDKVVSNLKTLLRLRNRNTSLNDFKDALLNESIVGIDNWVNAYELPEREMVNKLSMYFDDFVIDGINDFLKNNDANELEYVFLDYYDEKLKELTYDDNSIAAILYYLHLKRVETFKLREMYYEK